MQLLRTHGFKYSSPKYAEAKRKQKNAGLSNSLVIKFMFSKKTTKIDKIFTIDLTVTTYCQIDGEDFVNFCDLLRKHELYEVSDTKVVPMRYSIK